MPDWHETDAFWEDFYPVMFHDGRWEAARSEVDGILSLSGIEPGARILDVCCGPGRHSLELARRGHVVTGIDRTASYIVEARDRASQAGLDLDLRVGDVRALSETTSYDATISIYSSIGYFDDVKERSFLAKVYGCIRDPGVFVLDTVGKEIVISGFKEQNTEEISEGLVLEENRKAAPDWSWIENRWTLTCGDVFKAGTWRTRLYSGPEISAALQDVGFASVELFGDWLGSEYDDQARRLIVIARK